MAGSKSKSSKARKRGGGKSKGSPKGKAPPAKEGAENGHPPTETSTSSPSELLRARLAELKPFLWITLLVALPLGFQTLYLYVCLQRPEWLATVATVLPALAPKLSSLLRPSLTASDARQVLVVGTQSSGTTQVAHDLRTLLGLEIGHENSESRWSFVRDGTVSWFHGIRFVPRPGIDDPSARAELELPLPHSKNETTTRQDEEFASEATATATKTVTLEGERLFVYVVNLMCRELHPNMGFHPFMFRDNGTCSLRQSWGKCWKDECTSLLEHEWGCALRETPSSPSSSSCVTPYQKTLHQVRHPLRTVESLVTKFCIGGVEGSVQPSFVVFASAWFPSYDFSKLSCIEAAGYYVYGYQTSLIQATKKGFIDSSYQVEESTPCEIAELAGFLDALPGEEEEKSLLGGHSHRMQRRLTGICSGETAPTDQDTTANQQMASTRNQVNQGQLSLEWDDLLGGRHGSQKKPGDKDLRNRLKKLTKELGYNH